MTVESHEIVVKILGTVPDYAECEIVRCKDCRWAKLNHSDNIYHCNMWISDVIVDGFCWRGWRKEN